MYFLKLKTKNKVGFIQPYLNIIMYYKNSYFHNNIIPT